MEGSVIKLDPLICSLAVTGSGSTKMASMSENEISTVNTNLGN